jgi:hypothetical protein
MVVIRSNQSFLYFLSHGQPFKRAHWSTSRCPFSAAYLHVSSSQGQPFSLVANSNCSVSLNRWKAHFNTSKCPLYAAFEHVHSSHGQPFKRAHFTTSRCPFFAANVFTCEHVSQRMSCHSMDNHSTEPILIHPDVHSMLHMYIYLHSVGNHFFWSQIQTALVV